MTIHTFQPTVFYNTLGSHPPVLHIADGDTVITPTPDARGVDKDYKQVANRGNPMVGPFYIDGAEPGDTLVVHLDRIDPNRPTGWTRQVLAEMVVDFEFVRELPNPQPPNEIIQWNIDPVTCTASLVEENPYLGGLSLPLAPMLGCFGVAPEIGQAISTATSGNYGGNMDYRGFVAGVTVYFPVWAPGGLFHLGDGHAIQGDGEIVGTGIEVSMDVQFTVKILKGKRIGWPRGENEQVIFTTGNARPLDQATQHATTEMLKWLVTDYGLDYTSASILMGQCVEYDLGNMYDPAYTMVCKMPKRVLDTLPRG
jgi:acetamidase/formamidase